MGRRVLMATVALAFWTSAVFAQKLPERWIYFTAHLRDDENAEKSIQLLRDAKASGCTHALFVACRGHRLAQEPTAYFERMKRFQDEAKKLDIRIVPSVCSIGYSGRYLNVDSNLVSGIPVRNMAYVVKGRSAAPDVRAALDVSLLKPDKSGQSFVGNPKVPPFMYYRLSYDVVTAGEGRVGSYASVSSNGYKRMHLRTDPVVKKVGDRTMYQYVFNTLEAQELRVGIYHGAHKLENVRIEPAGMLLIIRRPRIPLTVTSEDGKTTYEEGRDFKPVADPVVAVRPFPGEFPFDHPAPLIELTDASRIRDGERLLVSFWHHQRLGSDQDVISLQEPRVWEVFEDEVRQVTKAWNAEGYFLNYDEIRVGLWEPREPGEENLTPGQFLARHFKRAYDLVRKYAPAARIYTWNDMFDPNHNARPFGDKGYYYLVNGNWDGSWEGLPRDVVILNWYSPTPAGLKFFADRGHEQILCGYYDGRTTDQMKQNIHKWMTVLPGVPGVRGWMFTTWTRRYPFMKEYFELLDSYDAWKGAMPAPK